MTLFNKQLSSIVENDLQDLIGNRVLEGKQIEYKQQLPSNRDSDKEEFLKDISSLANASGGDLILGIREENNEPVEVCGLQNINTDQAIQRLENMIRDGISPRIIGKEITAIELQSGSVVIIIRIYKSWALPHMVVFRGHNRFYTRNSNGKHPMDVSEIRAAFTLSEATIDRIRNFRHGRLAMITAGETPVTLPDNPKIVLHIIPMGAFDPSVKHDLTIIEGIRHLLGPIYSGASGHRFNVDGVLIYSGNAARTLNAYTQFFRNGIIECVEADQEGHLRHGLVRVPGARQPGGLGIQRTLPV